MERNTRYITNSYLPGMFNVVYFLYAMAIISVILDYANNTKQVLNDDLCTILGCSSHWYASYSGIWLDPW